MEKYGLDGKEEDGRGRDGKRNEKFLSGEARCFRCSEKPAEPRCFVVEGKKQKVKSGVLEAAKNERTDQVSETGREGRKTNKPTRWSSFHTTLLTDHVTKRKLGDHTSNQTPAGINWKFLWVEGEPDPSSI